MVMCCEKVLFRFCKRSARRIPQTAHRISSRSVLPRSGTDQKRFLGQGAAGCCGRKSAHHSQCQRGCSVYDNRLHESSALYTNILLIGLVVFCAAGLTGARAAANAASAIHYSSGLAAQGQTFSYVWYSNSAACAMAALFSYAVSSVSSADHDVGCSLPESPQRQCCSMKWRQQCMMAHWTLIAQLYVTWKTI